MIELFIYVYKKFLYKKKCFILTSKCSKILYINIYLIRESVLLKEYNYNKIKCNFESLFY